MLFGGLNHRGTGRTGVNITVEVLHNRKPEISLGLFLQVVGLYKANCVVDCDNCTLGQMLDWKHVIKTSNHSTVSYAVSLPGRIHSVHISSSTSNPCVKVNFEWVQRHRVQIGHVHQEHEPDYENNMNTFKSAILGSLDQAASMIPGLSENDIYAFAMRNISKTILNSTKKATSNDFPRYSEYNQHLFKVSTKTRVFWFVKYTDRTHTSGTEYKPFLNGTLGALNFWRLLVDTYPYPSCRNIVHRPKRFSWTGAQSLCRNAKRMLPEFQSRPEQEEFLSMLEQLRDALPFDAAFIGLRGSSHRAVRTRCQSTIQSSFSLLQMISK